MFQECVSNVAESLHIFWGYWEYAAKYVPWNNEKGLLKTMKGIQT